MRAGLLGRKLSHSYSPLIHSFLGNYSYELFEREPDMIKSLLDQTDLRGCNVTIPYKKAVIQYLDILSPTAQKLGSVNTIIRTSDGKLYGYNTDHYGSHQLILKSGIEVSGKKILVLGSGGASNTVIQVLYELGAEPVIISRSGEYNYDNLHIHKDAQVIINTTPVGMYPDTDASPIEVRQFPRLKGVIDLIYNPYRTRLLMDAEENGIPNINGLWMLVAQAKRSAELFLETELPDSIIGEIHREVNAKMRNIILIGMPGCGKSTVGNALANALGKPFLDSDYEICRMTGKSIPQIIQEDGEAAFRKKESKVLLDFGKRSGIILATGGGCVTVPENRSLLRQNSTVIWLQRALEKLPTYGRPLSQTTSLQKMYEMRAPLYEQFSDVIVSNDGSLDDTINSIIQYLEEKQ